MKIKTKKTVFNTWQLPAVIIQNGNSFLFFPLRYFSIPIGVVIVFADVSSLTVQM